MLSIRNPYWEKSNKDIFIARYRYILTYLQKLFCSGSAFSADVLGQGRLDEDAVDGGVGIEVVEDLEELVLGDRERGEDDAAFDTDLRSGLLLFLHIGNGGGVVADAYEGDAGLAAVQGGDFGFEFRDDVGGGFVSVDEFHGEKGRDGFSGAGASRRR